MLELEKWAAGKPLIVAKIAQSFVLKSDVFQDFDSFLSYFRKLDYFQNPSNLPEWLNLYRNNKRVSCGVISAFRSIGGIAGEIADLYEFLITHRRNAKPSKETKSPSEISSGFEKIFSHIS